MSTLRVREVCRDSRVFRRDGELLRAAIAAASNDPEGVTVDFEHEPIRSISFLDEGVAVLFVEHDAELIRRRLRVTNMVEDDRRELNRLVAKRRTEYRAA